MACQWELPELRKIVDSNDLTELNVILSEQPQLAKQSDPISLQSLLHYCCLRNISEEIARLLIYFQADVNAKETRGFTPLHFTAIVGNWKTTKVLLESANVNIEAKTMENFTPLSLAVQWSPPKTITEQDLASYQYVLRSLSNDFTTRNTTIAGDTVIHIATGANNICALQYLLEHHPTNVNLINE
jgi:ankyrin repeat protein